MLLPTCFIAAVLVLVGLLGQLLGHPDPATGHVSATALIPAWIGLALAALAALVHKYPASRMHAMHTAALLALLAAAGTAFQLCKILANTPADPAVAHLKIFSMSATLLLCLLFLVLCIRSFIHARRNRQS